MSIITSLSEKIESIRQQPEYMRIRYVWGCVAISMFIIFVLWIFSIASMFTKKTDSNQTNNETLPSITEQLQTIKEQAPSLKDINDQAIMLGNENDALSNQNPDIYQPSPDISDGIEPDVYNPYADLPNINVTQ